MRALGGIIKDETVTGITPLCFMQEGDNFWYQFSVLTSAGPVLFQSEKIQDIRIATPLEMEYLNNYRLEYDLVKDNVASLLGEYSEEFQFHNIKVNNHFKYISELHIDLEKSLLESSSKKKHDYVRQLNAMRPHIIELKNLAE